VGRRQSVPTTGGTTWLADAATLAKKACSGLTGFMGPPLSPGNHVTISTHQLWTIHRLKLLRGTCANQSQFLGNPMGPNTNGSCAVCTSCDICVAPTGSCVGSNTLLWGHCITENVVTGNAQDEEQVRAQVMLPPRWLAVSDAPPRWLVVSDAVICAHNSEA